MAFCKDCGNENPPGAAYCVHCGSAITLVRSDVETAMLQGEGDAASKTTAGLMEALRHATLGEYEIMAELGRGGMAVVYLAHDLALDRKVAIKVISPTVLWLGEGIAERFKREARTAASLSHPHIIPIYAVKESDDLLFFVMKFVKGRTLESVIAEVGPLPVAMVHTILSQVGSALGYAHRQGVVHRDVKPGNIMLDEEGWAVVTDFGIAKVTAAQGLTQTGGTVGTPAYMSPEQCSGLPVAGGSDQYSLGVVAYEMLTGQKPFDAKSAVALMYKHCNTPAEPILDRLPHCPVALADSVMRMLAKDPLERWPRLEDMVSAIGTVPSSESDEVRTQMLTLAKSSSAQAIVEKFRTPSSPVPRDRLSGSIAAATGPRRATGPEDTPPPELTRELASVGRRVPKLVWAFAPVAAAVAVFVWAPWRSAEQTDPPPMAAPPVVNTSPATPTQPTIASIEIVPTTGMLMVGDTLRLVPSVLDDRGTMVEDIAVTWESSNPEVARISSRGLVSALSPGRTEISAWEGDFVGTAEIVVEARTAQRPALAQPARPAVAAVALTPSSATVSVGETVTFSATPRTRDGRSLSDRTVSWSSSDPAIARISSAGVVTGMAAGRVSVSASSEGRSGSATVTVTPVAVASVDVTPPEVALDVGERRQLSAVVRDAGGNTLTGRAVSWSSGDGRVASVSPAGIVTGAGAGTTTITATSGQERGTARVTVTAPPPAIVVDPGPEIEAVVRAYGAAIQDRDLGELQRLYPGMTPQQEESWSTFFDVVRDLRATISLTAVDIDGDRATANAEMTLAFRNGGGRTQDTTPIRMVLERQGGIWRITTVR